MGNGQGQEYRPGSLMQLVANDGNQDRMIQATELLNQRLKDIKQLRNVTDCNTLLLCHYKNSIVSTLSIDVVMMICKFINPMFHPVSMFNYLNLKRERTECFNTFILCIKNLPIPMLPKDVKKILFNEYKTEVPPPKPFVFEGDIADYDDVDELKYFD